MNKSLFSFLPSVILTTVVLSLWIESSLSEKLRPICAGHQHQNRQDAWLDVTADASLPR
jgi:hypothetical protein